MKKFFQNIPGPLYFLVWLGIVVFVATPLGTSIWRIFLSLIMLTFLVRFIGEKVYEANQRKKISTDKKIVDSNKVELNNENKVINISNDNIHGNLEGPSIDWWWNGNKKTEEYFKNGLKEGLSTSWGIDGKKLKEQCYKNGSQEGLYTMWHDNGTKYYETYYKNGFQEGLHTGWYENGLKSCEISFIEGKYEGLCTWWYQNGNMRSKGCHKNDLLEGLRTEWYENGNKRSEIDFIEGKYAGLYITWYSNGQKELEGNIRNEEMDTNDYKLWNFDGTECFLKKKLVMKNPDPNL